MGFEKIVLAKSMTTLNPHETLIMCSIRNTMTSKAAVIGTTWLSLPYSTDISSNHLISAGIRLANEIEI